MKKFLDERHERIRQEFYSNVRPWIAVGVAACKALSRRLTSAEYKSLIDLWGGANSYERRVLVPLLDDAALADLATYYIGQGGGKLGELSIAKSYNDAVEREFAPLLVERLRESANLLKIARQYAEEWGRCQGTIEHLKKSVAGQQKRADKAESEHLLVQKDLFKAWEERDAARKQAATWEIQAQDLRDQLIQVKSELAALKVAEPSCTGCGQPMETTLCWECAR